MWGSYFYFRASWRLKTLALVSMAIPVCFLGLSRPVMGPLGRPMLPPSFLHCLAQGPSMQLSYALKNVLIVLYPEFLGLFVVSLKNYQSLHLIEKEPHLHFFFLMLVLSITLHGLFLYFSNETRALVISRQQPGTQETNRKRESVRAPSQHWGWPGRRCSLSASGVFGAHKIWVDNVDNVHEKKLPQGLKGLPQIE